MPSMNEEYREVYFYQYCPKCRYSKHPEEADPCAECLEEPYNQESHKPVNFKPVGSNASVEKYEKKLSKEEEKYIDAIGNVFEV